MMLWQILLALWLARVSSLEPSQFRWFKALEVTLNHRGIATQSFLGSFLLLIMPLLVVEGISRFLVSMPALELVFQWLVLFVCLTGPTNTASEASSETERYLTEVIERWLAPLFWFILAGAVGVLAYRLLALQAPRLAMARQARDWAEWLPVRLLAIALPLMGHFLAIEAWRANLWTVAAVNRLWIVEVAEQAVLAPMDSPQQLVKRSLLLLLALLAALSLFGALN